MAGKRLTLVGAVLGLLKVAFAATCEVAGGTSDDGPAIAAAMVACNNGGTVLLDKTYTIGSLLETTGLNNVAIELTGTINLSTNLTYWQKSSFQLTYQSAYTAWVLGGTGIHFYGGGTYNGGGDSWYSAGKTGPVMLTVYNSQNVLIENLNINKSPFWHFFVDGCTDVTFQNMNLNSVQTSGKQAQNTDGWDIYRSSYVTIQDSNIVNGDDCVSFKPNSTYITVQNLDCTGSHGISVGSLGQYAGEVDIVENVYVYNVSMNNAENGARIKAWGGSASSTSTSGGGSGSVSNITFSNFKCSAVTLPIVIDQCYSTSASTCASYPSLVQINDVHYIDVTGTGTKSYEVVSLVCSDLCNDITATGTDLVGTKGGAEYICQNIESTALLDFPCDASGVTVSGTSTKTSTTTKTTSTKTTATTTTTTKSSSTKTTSTTTKTTSTTTKTSSTSTKTTSTTTKTTSSSNTQTVYGQCGGSGYTGATVCASGATCSSGNAYYYQCVPTS